MNETVQSQPVENTSTRPSSLHLPAELVLHIINVLRDDVFMSRSDVTAALLVCCLVSRDWSFCAQQCLFACVEVRTSRSALRFMDTLEIGRCGVLVQSVRFWTGVYKERTVAGPLFAPRAIWRRAAVTALQGDRFLSCVVCHCPNLTSIALQNRARGQMVTIYRALPHGYAFDVLQRLTFLNLDCSKYSRARSSAHWIVIGLSSGDLILPNLVELRLRSLVGYQNSPGSSWSHLPKLRNMVLSDFALFSQKDCAAIQALLAAASPSLENLHLCRVTWPANQNIHLDISSMTSLKRICIYDCVFLPTYIPFFILPVTNTLEELGIGTSWTLATSAIEIWPQFERLTCLHLAWHNIVDWTIVLLASVLPQLRELDINLYQNRSWLGTAAMATAATVVLDALAVTPSTNLETLALEGNIVIDLTRLSSIVESMSRLKTLRIGRNLSGLPEFLSPSFRTLELRLGGNPSQIEDFLEYVVPTALPTLSFLERLHILEDTFDGVMGWQWGQINRGKLISQFLSKCKTIGGPQVYVYVENHDAAWSWKARTAWYPPSDMPNALSAEMGAGLATFASSARRIIRCRR